MQDQLTIPAGFGIFPEKKIRIGGYLVVTAIFFLFFMLEMAFSWQDEHLYVKICLLTFLHTLMMWEPVRMLILHLRKRFSGLSQVKLRLRILVCIAVPYAVLIGFLRIFLEDHTNLWGVPMASWSAYSYTIGITLLFILLQIAVYESLYFFSEWKKVTIEAEEIRRMNVQIQVHALKVQIQPHFLFNTLNTLIGLIETNRNEAIHFTQNLSFVYRYLLEANERTLISLGEELKFAHLYFNLLQTRYPEGLELVAEMQGADLFQLPPLSLQILIENAVKHNTSGKLRPLHIYLYLDQRRQQVIVQNNFQPKKGVVRSGVGLQHLKKKFELLGLPGIMITETGEEFIVCLPLIKKEVYEYCHH
jgi:hypothetical protein